LLNEILNAYSAGELAGLIGEEIVAEYEKLIDRTVEKPDLVNAVQTLYGYELVSQEDEREKLIDRMNQDQVQTIIDQFLDEHKDEIDLDQSVSKYNVLIHLSNRWPERFISILGYQDALELSAASELGISGISSIESAYPLYPYQQRMVKKVNTLIRSEQDHRCLLHLPTGAGKTRTAMNIASEHLRENEDGLVLWLADTSELCSQAGSEFTKAWGSLGNRNLKLYSYYSDTNISLGGIDSGFLVAGLQKLNSARGSEEYRILYKQLQKYVTLIIFDEAHKAIAPTYAQTVNDMIKAKKETFLLGLSATPGRKLENNSDEDEKLTQFFHSNKVTMQIAGYESPIKYLVEQEYLAKANFENIEYDGNKILLAEEFSNQKRSSEIRQALSEDESRNLKLLEVIGDEHQKGSSIIVFACSVEHSRALASMLAFNGIKAYSLDSKYDDDESRRYKISDYSKGNVRVLINFNILTAGFDAPITNVAVIARPTDSLVQYSQMAGRAMRGSRSGGNRECNIYTVRDDIPAFTSVAQAFTHWDRLWSEV
jgi:superfamily II DNA or RNA helicase